MIMRHDIPDRGPKHKLSAFCWCKPRIVSAGDSGNEHRLAIHDNPPRKLPAIGEHEEPCP